MINYRPISDEKYNCADLVFIVYPSQSQISLETAVKPEFGLSISTILTAGSALFPHHTNIWASGKSQLDRPTLSIISMTLPDLFPDCSDPIMHKVGWNFIIAISPLGGSKFALSISGPKFRIFSPYSSTIIADTAHIWCALLRKRDMECKAKVERLIKRRGCLRPLRCRRSRSTIQAKIKLFGDRLQENQCE